MLLHVPADFGYIPTVIFVSYFGSRAKNRAKWIGVGTLITAIANYMIASTNFLFPAITPALNVSKIGADL